MDDTTTSAYEKQLLNRGQGHLQQAINTFVSKIQTVEGEREANIARFSDDTEKFLREMELYCAKKRELGRDVTIHLSSKWYFTFIFLIVIGEFALNSQAFEVFQKATWLTWIMALTVAVGLPFVAHFTGIWIKQWPKPGWKTGVKVILTVSATFACLVGLNIARREYLALQGSELDSRGAILERAFLLINIFVFIAATIMSYFAHDADQELENLHDRTTSLNKGLDRFDANIHKLGGKIDTLKMKEQAELEEIRHIILELVHMYRDQNVLSRPDGVKPKVFEQDPKLEEPKRGDEIQKLTAEERVNEIRQRRRSAMRDLSPSASPETSERKSVAANNSGT